MIFSIQDEIESMVVRKNLGKSKKKEMNIIETELKYGDVIDDDLTESYKAAAAELKKVIRARHFIRFTNYKGFYHSVEYDSFQRASKCEALS